MFIIHPTDALGIEQWKQEVKKVEENVKALQKKYTDRCKELEVGSGYFVIFDRFRGLPYKIVL